VAVNSLLLSCHVDANSSQEEAFFADGDENRQERPPTTGF
jgi:hypothetical protein